MRYIYITMLLVLAAFSTHAQTFYSEDFDDCSEPSDWTTDIVSGSANWTFSDNPGPNDLMPTGSIDGSCMVFFDDDILGGGAPASAVDLTSPVIDLSSLDTAVLRFDYLYFQGTGQSFEVALWNGASWDTVFVTNATTACADFTCTADEQIIDLSGYLNADFQAKFIYNDGAGWNWYVALDNIEIYVPPTVDAIAVEGIGPASACGLSATEELSIVVFNNSASEITSITAGFEAGAQNASETFTITIPAGESDTLDFTTPFDMSLPGVYDIDLWVELTGDEDSSNDTISIAIENIPVISSLPYSEGFESGNGFWNSGGPVSTWELGAPTNSVINEANNGVSAWVTNLIGDYAGAEDSYVESPCFDFSALSVDPIFRFAHIFDTENCCDEGFVDVSIDGGTTWTRLGLAGQGVNWYDDAVNNEWDGDGAGGAGSMWRTAQHVLDGVAGESSVKIRLGFSADGSINGEGFGFDDIEIFEFPTINAGVTEIISPVNGCGLGSEEVTIVFENTGLEDVVDFNIGYNAGSGDVTQFITDTLFVAEIDTVTFTTPVDLSTVGSYNIIAWTEVTGDGDPGNDSTDVSIENIPVISTLPYFEDFESGAGGWVSGQIDAANTWELGLPTNSFIDTAFSGVNAWVTDLDGNYLVNEESFVESPCMDFSTLTLDPVLRFAYKASTESFFDGAWVEVSYDAGANWLKLGNNGEGTNWYNSAGNDWWDDTQGTQEDWVIGTHLIDSAAGESSVKLRIRFSSDFSGVDEGFAFDNVEIFEQPPINVAVNEVISPITGCGLSATEEVTIVVENVGDADVVDYDLGFNVGAGDVVELQGDTLFAGEIDTITFTAPADLSVNGTYEIAAWAAVAGDGDALNDSIFTSVTSSPVVSTLPYLTDFESGADGWYSETGNVGIWELGDPEGTLIDTANSGVNAWSTNLNTLAYQDNQLSYLISPCFDFSGLVIDPILEFAFISNSEPGFDGMWLEASTDAGATWSTVGNVGEGTNWYNNADEHGPTFSDDWWDGDTQDSTEWIVAENLIAGVAGSSDVVLRFVFDSDGSFGGEGFAIDDISITEQPPINAELTSLESPESACGLTASETVEVIVTNLGSVDMDSVILGYTFDGGTAFEQIFNDTLQPNESDTFEFAQPIDLSTNGDYDLVVWVAAINDGDTDNDTLTTTITSVPTVASFPYFIDFESGSGGWIAGGVPSVWELGEPETAFIDTANSGVNAWVTVLNGDYPNLNNDTAYVESPCLDFSGITADPILSFAGIFETESCCDEGWVEISLDGGLTWDKLGAAGEGINWYNDAADDFWNGVSGPANQWLEAEHLLDGAAGQSSVKIRFAFSSDGSVTDAGFGLDDISIREQPQFDLAVISFDGPKDGCDLGDEEVTMTFWNKGLQAVSGFDLGFRVDGGAAQTETYTASVNPDDTVSYTFTTELADLSGAGTYSIDVFTALAGDEDLSSDTLFNGLAENFGTSTPLTQTEETGGVLISNALPEGTSSSLFFCGLPESLDGCLEIVSLSIDSLNHTWLSDLEIFLISPTGDSLELSTDNGGSLDNMVNVVFTDTATNNIITQTSGIAPGFYFPEDSAGFASFYTGQNPNGGWTLWINDDLGGDNGELFSWTLTFKDNSPVPTVSQSDTTICITQVLTVSVNETYDSYLWSTGNNTQEIDLFGNILGLGDTEVSVTVDQDGCTGTSDSFTLTVDACAGIDELTGLNIELYPNPTNGTIMLDIEGESDGFVVDVLDINGKSVHNQSIGSIASGVRKAIDLSHVADGMYFLRLDDGQSTITRKLIKR